MSSVTQFWEYGLPSLLGVPYSVRSQIRDSSAYSSEEEKRMAGVEYYLQTVPGASWGRVAGVLWFLGEHAALEAVKQFPPQSGNTSRTNTVSNNIIIIIMQSCNCTCIRVDYCMIWPYTCTCVYTCNSSNHMSQYAIHNTTIWGLSCILEALIDNF